MSFDYAAVGGHLIALLQHHPIASHQLIGGDLLQPAIAPHPGLGGQVACQGLQRALSLVLLPKRKQGIDPDHRPDRPAQLGGTGDEGQATGHPQQQGHEVKKLVGEAQQQRPPPHRRQLISPVTLQPIQGFRTAQSVVITAQGLESLSYRQRPNWLNSGEQHRQPGG